jgi:hypothetical protein
MELQIIQNKIYEVRGQKVMLDFDLAKLYNVETKALKQAVRRNIERFPADFMFELTDDEYNSLSDRIRSQIVTLEMDGRGKYPKYAPFAFTEEGVAMLSGVLHSKIAVEINISIMRAFVTLRNQIANNADIVAELGSRYNERLQWLERKFDARHEAIVHRLSNVERRLGCRHSRPQTKHLSYEIKIRDYSRKAVVIFTENTENAQLLLAIGARHNSWLTWQGERVKGWVFPKSRFDEILQLLPEDWFMQKSNRHEN